MNLKLPTLKPHIIKQAAVSTIIGAMIAVVESKSILGAYHAQADQLAGIQMGAISGLSAVLAFAGFNLTGMFKDDIRKSVRDRVWPTRLIALAFMITPVGFFGSALKMDRLEAHYATYSVSPAYDADVILMNDMMSDRMDREAARARTVAPVTPDLQMFDSEFWIALFLLSLLNFAGEALRVPAPVTDEERAHIRKLEIAEKTRITKARNAYNRKRRAEAARPAPKPRFGIFQGGKA